MAVRLTLDTLPSKSPLVSTPVETVFINGRKAVVIGAVAKNKSVVIQGSNNVLFEGISASRYADMSTTGPVESASPDVYVNNR